MGKFFVRPKIQDCYGSPPRLKWYQVILDNQPTGDILASFQLQLVQFFFHFLVGFLIIKGYIFKGRKSLEKC